MEKIVKIVKKKFFIISCIVIFILAIFYFTTTVFFVYTNVDAFRDVIALRNKINDNNFIIKDDKLYVLNRVDFWMDNCICADYRFFLKLNKDDIDEMCRRFPEVKKYLKKDSKGNYINEIFE